MRLPLARTPEVIIKDIIQLQLDIMLEVIIKVIMLLLSEYLPDYQVKDQILLL